MIPGNAPALLPICPARRGVAECCQNKIATPTANFATKGSPLWVRDRVASQETGWPWFVWSRSWPRELMVLMFAIGSALTLAVFFLALLLLPFETFTPFPFPRFPGFF
jgi:hypothetical protein